MKRFFIPLLVLIVISSCTNTTTPPGDIPSGPKPVDLILLIDTTGSSATFKSEVNAGIVSFCDQLENQANDIRISVVLFGSAPEIVVDWTTDFQSVAEIVQKVNPAGAVPGVHLNHNTADDTALESVRIVLNSAVNNTLERTYVGGAGPLDFRSNAEKKLFLYTDEASNATYFSENSVSTTPTFDSQAEIDATADILIDLDVETILMVYPRQNDVYSQFSDYRLQVQQSDFSAFDADATLAELNNNSLNSCVQAQLLAAGIPSRCVHLSQAGGADMVTNVYMDAVSDSFN